MTPRTPITGEEVADVLERAADLLEQPGKWTQGYYARSSLDGVPVSVADGQCFCAIGAIASVWGIEGADAHDWEIGFNGWPGFGSLGAWNDAPERTQAEVVAALRSAATAARQQGEGK